MRYGFEVGERPRYQGLPSVPTRAPGYRESPAEIAQHGERRRSVGELLDPGGEFTVDLLNQQIRMGSATTPSAGTGIFIGLSDGDYEFRVGNPSGDHIHWDGTSLTIEGELDGASGTFSGTLDAVDGTFSTITAGTLSGSNITIDLDAQGGDPVIEGDQLIVRASGAIELGDDVEIDTSGNATFSGTVAADQFTAPNANFDGNIVVDGLVSVGSSGLTNLEDDGLHLNDSTLLFAFSFYFDGSDPLIEANTGFTLKSSGTVQFNHSAPAASDLSSLLSALDSLGIIDDTS